MDNGLKNNDRLDEGYTEFGPVGGRQGTFLAPVGAIGKFFAKFFATKAQKTAANIIDRETATDLHGDTIVSDQIIRTEDSKPRMGLSVNRILPQQELNRRKRYMEYEKMDEYPEIGAAFDIYADEASQRGLKGERWTVEVGDETAHEEINNLFKNIDLKTFLWDIVRNTCKYGDNFLELVVDVNNPQFGIKKIKILNPGYVLRVEDEFGRLDKFMQEIPSAGSINGGSYSGEKPLAYIDLDKHQMVHFRLHTSDPIFYPYGKSIAALSHRIYRSLKMMEDAMMIYRITRAPERRIFYVETGNMPTTKVESFIERLKQSFKKEKFYNPTNGTVDARFNPMSMDEDYFVPQQNGKGTKIDTLPGAQNLDQIEDVKYYRDKLLASLKIPKDYIVEKDKSPERKANLSQLDVKFARTIQRVQQSVEKGLESIAKRHLELKGYPRSIVHKVVISLPEPSDISVKRKLEIDEQKNRIIQAVKGVGLLSNDALYREYFDYSEDEIRKLKAEIKQDKEEQKQYDLASAAAAGASGGAGNVSPNGTPAAPPVQESKKSTKTALERLMEKTSPKGDKKTILEGINSKVNDKVEKTVD